MTKKSHVVAKIQFQFSNGNFVGWTFIRHCCAKIGHGTMNGCLFFMFRNNDNIADNNTTTKSTLCKKDVIFKNLDKTLRISIM